MEQLLLVGAGGFAREVAEAVRALNERQPRWQLLGLLDDDPARHGAVLSGGRVIGPVELVHEHPAARVVLCTGNPQDYGSRERLVERLGLEPQRYATVVHPAANLSASTVLGLGSAVLAGVVATADVTVGRHVALMPACVLTHDVVLGDFVTVASGALLSGAAQISAGAYVGAGAMVGAGLRMGRGSMLGMGAVLRNDLPDHEVWAGVPARRLRATTIVPLAAEGETT